MKDTEYMLRNINLFEHQIMELIIYSIIYAMTDLIFMYICNFGKRKI